MTFFTDENLSHVLARMIEVFDPDNKVIPHRDHFTAGTADDVWIPAVAAWSPKPATILGDGRVLRSRKLKLIARDSGLSFVVMADRFVELAWADQAWKFIKLWPDLVKVVSKAHGTPMIFDVKVRAMEIEARHATADLRE